jgi:hypothetical protein
LSDITPEFVRAVSDETGVPEWLLTQGGINTTEGIWSRARDAVNWKTGTAPPRPQTAAVSASVPYKPMTPQPLGEVSVMDAYRQGRLADRGAPAPPPRAPRDRRGMPW